MNHRIAFVSCLVWLAGHAAAQTPELDHFESQVRPLLIEHCQKCHGPKKAESSLRVDSRDALVKGGDSGPAIVPGQPSDSLLWQAVNHEGYEMPPSGKLGDDQLAAIERWIKEGAVWPGGESVAPALGDQEHIGKLAQEHWAFQPIEPVALPDSPEPNPIDKFVATRLTAAGVEMSASAGSRQLIRRLSHDLTGLPPSPEEVERFASDPGEDAWKSQIERLLSSKHFGEHWGRHWLDLARYADTRDWFARGDLNYPFAWTYRDYVIRSFNENLAWNEFIRQQLAADHLTSDETDPTRAALGFLTVGSRFRNRQHEQIADYIDVVTRGLLGLTVGCARCHDHKYDPIPTADYYSLHGIFASSKIPEKFPLVRDAVVDEKLAADYERERQKRQEAFDKFLEELKQEGLKDIRSRWATYLEGFAEVASRKESLANASKKRQLKSRAAGSMFTRLFLWKQSAPSKEHVFFGPWAQLFGLDGEKFSSKRDEILEKGAETLHPEMTAILEDDAVKDSGELTKRVAGVMQRSMDAEDDDALAELRDFVLDDAGPFSFKTTDMEPHPETVGKERNRFEKAKAPLTKLEVEHAGAPPRSMVMLDGRGVDSPIHVRGDFRRRGETVPRQFLTFISASSDDAESPLSRKYTEGSGRLQLADALVDPENPLTARVLVNWVWRHYFGRGFILASDFGLRTPEPEHRELLDYLASGLIENGWDSRWLHRTILQSKTYRQSSTASERLLSVDPENNLFGRQTRRRLGFETMRDAMLAVSGRLDRSSYGRPAPPTDASTRRAVYLKVDRVDFDATRATFDFPRPDAAATERIETTVPQQLLFALNSPFVIDCAREVVSTEEFAALEDDEQRARWLVHRILQREPTESELRAFVSFAPAPKSIEPPTWSRGYGSGSPEDSGDARFQPFPHYTGRQYQIGAKFPDKKLGHVCLHQTGGHPGNKRETAAIVRWTAPMDAEVRVQGQLDHPSESGDGVVARTVHGGNVLGEWSARKSKTPTPINRVRVRKGDTIDFVVECGPGGSGFDSYKWNQIITVLKPLGKERPFPAGYRWNAREMFSAPPPKPIARWEMAAQALLVSNEFFYVD